MKDYDFGLVNQIASNPSINQSIKQSSNQAINRIDSFFRCHSPPVSKPKS
jgi:hypothetical protein